MEVESQGGGSEAGWSETGRIISMVSKVFELNPLLHPYVSSVLTLVSCFECHTSINSLMCVLGLFVEDMGISMERWGFQWVVPTEIHVHEPVEVNVYQDWVIESTL